MIDFYPNIHLLEENGLIYIKFWSFIKSMKKIIPKAIVEI